MHNKLISLLCLGLAAVPCYALGEYMTASDGVGKISYFTCPGLGDMRFPVIFVTYQDVEFNDEFENVKAHFEDKFNLEGFDWRESPGSVRDYFLQASGERFRPTFDFYGPVQLENERSYYGTNDSRGVDQNCGDMVIEAVKALKDDIDWSLYDINGDGNVDDVVIVYAGASEYSGGGAESILPKSYLISFDKYADYRYNRNGCSVGNNYYVNSYTAINEIANGEYDGIGTFVHEFMHGLGLADVYTTYDQGAAYTPRYYDVMDVGIYNNDSLTPPTTSAFERYALGWIDLEVIDSPCEIELTNLLDSNHAYIMPISDTEFYVLENRQQEGWDEYIPGHGMLIWHIHYSSSLWYANTANRTETHQRIDLIEACGCYSLDPEITAAYPFPGTQNVTSYTPMAWSGDDLGLTITDIAESADGIITATVRDLAGIGSVLNDNNAKVTYYDLQGRKVNADNLKSGIYIKKQGTSTSKILIFE